jgi:CDP-glucose 4,6-dehydratase
VIARFERFWGEPVAWHASTETNEYEAPELVLSSRKARELLGWAPRWDLDHTLEATAEWYRAAPAGNDVQANSIAQIDAFESTDAAFVAVES